VPPEDYFAFENISDTHISPDGRHVTMFGQNTRELAWFVKAGMTPEEAFKTATVNAAELLGKSDDLGRAIPGHYADLISVEGDPLADIQAAIHNVRGVMKGGKVIR